MFDPSLHHVASWLQPDTMERKRTLIADSPINSDNALNAAAAAPAAAREGEEGGRVDQGEGEDKLKQILARRKSSTMVSRFLK